MEDLTLIRSNRALLWALIERESFTASDFGFEAVPSVRTSDALVSKLFHRDYPELYFVFEVSGGKHFTRRSPGSDGIRAEQAFPASWDGQLGYFVEWLNFVRVEIASEDPWQQDAATRELVALAQGHANNTPFNREEVRYIANRLDEIVRRIQTETQPDGPHREFMLGQVQYLREASERMGRKDWTMLAIGVLSSIAVALTVPTISLHPIFDSVAAAIRHVLE